MTILHRYIAKVIIAYIVLVAVVVIGLSFFIGLLGEFRDVGVGDYGLMEAFIHTLLRLPQSLYQFFPMVVLLGGILGLGMLASQQELMVMRTAGVSYRKIALAAMTGALALILMITLLGECISPQANFLADKRKDSAKNRGQAVATGSGIWIHEGDNFFHVQQVMGKRHLEGVTRYRFDSQHRLLTAYYAQKMDYEDNHWVLANLVQTDFSETHVTSQQFPQATWELVLSPNLLSVGMIEPDEMSLKSLSAYSKHLIKNGLEATEFQFSFWKRLFQPLATLVMILLVVPFVLSTSRSVVIGKRIFAGIIVGFIYYILDAFLGQISVVFQLLPWVAALLPIFIFACLGYFLTLQLS